MGSKYLVSVATSIILTVGVSVFAGDGVLPAPNGIAVPSGYKDWRVISSSYRQDNQTLRVIVGNDTAIAAARAGRTSPWPDGSILGKLAWKASVHPSWEKATVPGDFVQAEFMIKDADRYKETGGWGFARWRGLEQTPYGKDASFVQECFGCHLPVKESDYVFTRPSKLP